MGIKGYSGKMMVPMVALSLVLGACGSGGDKPAESTTDNSPKVDLNDPAAIKGNVTFMQWGTQEEVNQTKQLLLKFNAKYPNVKVEVVSKDWATYWTAITAQAASKKLPDVYKMDEAYLDKYAKLGAMRDLTDFIQKNSFDTNDFESGVLKKLQSDGKQYALPRDANTIVMFYNKKLFADSKTNPNNAPVPTGGMTWDELTDIAKKMTLDKSGKSAADSGFDHSSTAQWGLVMDGAGSADSVLESQLWSNGAKLVNDDHSFAMNTPEAMQVLNKFRSLIVDDHVVPDYGQIKSLSPDPFLALSTGKAAMGFAGSWNTSEFKQAGIEFEAFLPPIFKEEKTVVQVTGYAMSPNTKNETAAWVLLNWLSGPEGQIALAEQGQSIPANKQAVETFLAADEGFNKQVFIDSQKYVIPVPFFDGKEKLLWDLIPQKLALPLSGKGSLEDVVKDIAKSYGK